MKHWVLVFFLISSLCAGCDLAPENTEPELVETTQQKSELDAEKETAESYGEPLSDREPTALSKLLTKPDEFADQQVLVAGKVRRVCTKKGCWMEVSESASEEGPGARVTFKDYGFFVPTTSAGKDARVEGTVVVKKIEPSHVEHLESEGGRFDKKNEDGSATEVRIVATGVELSQG